VIYRTVAILEPWFPVVTDGPSPGYTRSTFGCSWVGSGASEFFFIPSSMHHLAYAQDSVIAMMRRSVSSRIRRRLQ
jgi:hypothetical protein